MATSAARHRHALVHPFRLTLVSFIEDLYNLEPTGLEAPQCQAVLDCLDSVVNHLKTVSTSSEWLGELSTPFNNLRADYFSWNNPTPGAHPASHRAKQCRALRKHKDGMLSRYTFGPLLATPEEVEIFKKAYDEFVKLEKIKAVGAQPQLPFKKTVEIAKTKKTAITTVA